jgi:hypothetical protein
MSIRAFDGSTWQNQKSLRIYNGSAWATAKQGWVYTGTQWSIMYPEFPLNTAAPSISATSGISGRIGCVYTVSVGTWNANDAYAPTSYSYQWTRNGSDIFNATGSSYTTVGADAETIIGCRITATNFRGSTPITISTGAQMLPQVTAVVASDNTATPNTPSSVSIGNTGLSYSGSFTTLDNISSYYEAVGGGTAGTPSVNSAAKTFSGTGTAGNASVSIRGVNTNKKIIVNWTQAPGAVSYDIYLGGSFFVNIPGGTTTSNEFTVTDTASKTFAVYPRSTNIQGYGVSAAAASASDKYSGYRTSATISLSNPVPTVISAPTLSPTGGYTAGQTLTYGVGSWANSPTSYDLRLYRGTPGVVMSETLVAAPGNTTSSTYTIPASDYDGTNRYYYRSFASATNSGGTSAYAAGTEGGPLAQPVVVPSGGSTSLSGSVSTGSLLSASTSGWANSPTSYFIKITRGTQNVASYETTVASSASTSTNYTVQAGDAGFYFKAFATASNSAGTSSEIASGELGPATNPVAVTAPGVPSVSQAYDGLLSGFWTWTLTINQGGGGTPTAYDWELQLSDSNTSTVEGSATGSVSGSGTKTVTRNSSTYSYARWRARARNSAGTSSYSAYTAWL